jgi:hypothetical protein
MTSRPPISDDEAIDNVSRNFPNAEIVKIRIERGSTAIVSVTAAIHAALVRGIDKIQIDIKEYSQLLLNAMTTRKENDT